MRPTDIKAAIEKRNQSLTSLARKHGYSQSAFSLAIRKTYPRVEKIIAQFLGISLHLLFPDRWHSDGTRLIKTGPRRSRRDYLHDNRKSATPSRERGRGRVLRIFLLCMHKTC